MMIIYPADIVQSIERRWQRTLQSGSAIKNPASQRENCPACSETAPAVTAPAGAEPICVNNQPRA